MFQKGSHLPRWATTFSLVAVFLVLSAAVAYADNDITVTRQNKGQQMRVWITQSGTTFTCSGTNTALGLSEVILVSAVCQINLFDTGWTDFEKAPKNYTTANTVTVHYTDNACTGADGGVNKSGDHGVYSVRAQADGWNRPTTGSQTEWGTPINTTSPYLVFRC